MMIKKVSIFEIIILIYSIQIQANTECIWATGLIKCQKDQTKVVNSTIEVYDLDRPQGVSKIKI